MDHVKFGNWQEFLENAVLCLQKNKSQMEHFKSLNSDEDRITFAGKFISTSDYKWIAEYFETTRLALNRKSSSTAANFRQKGNKLFKTKQFSSSLMYYNQSVMHAPHAVDEDNEMALAIANRSAVFYHLNEFEHSLRDISLALKLNYPKDLRYKLLQRAAQCHLKLGQFEDACRVLKTAQDALSDASFKDSKTSESCIEEISKLLAKAETLTVGSNGEKNEEKDKKLGLHPVCGINAILTQASSAIDVRQTQRKGRHLVANQNLRAGDLLIVERPYASILLPSHYSKRCHHCLTVLIAAYPCRNCTVVSYCSEECSKKSWDSYHQVECQYHDLLFSIGIAHLSLRVVLVAGLNYLLQIQPTLHISGNAVAGLSVDGKYDCSYHAVYHLMPHSEHIAPEDLFQYTLTAYLLLMCLDSRQFFKNFQDDKSRGYIGSLLLRHICQLVCNAHAITEIERVETSQASLVETSSQVRIATAIYPTASLMNHSCDPTIISSFVDDVLVVRAVKDVKTGDEIFNCYGPHWKRMSCAVRQQHLSEQYFFSCRCNACCQELEQEHLIKAFLCQHCGGPVITDRNGYMCTGCHRESTDDVALLVKQEDGINELWMRGLQLLYMERFDDALAALLEVLRYRQKTLHRHNKDLGEVNDALARCYAHKGDFGASCRHLSESVAATEAIYGSTSIELANELVKYAEVCASSRNTELASSVAHRALSIFTLNYGTDCDAADDLRRLLKTLSLNS